MKKLAALAAAASVAAAGAALAQPAERGADMARQQVIAQVDQRFARLDLDNDGRVTADEARQAAQQRRAQRAERMFDRLDANDDGSISRAEFDQAREQRQTRRAERRGGHAGMRPGLRGLHGMRMPAENGFVTREQMLERALARFDRLDADRDGTVTAAERRNAREQLRQRMRERRGQAD